MRTINLQLHAQAVQINLQLHVQAVQINLQLHVQAVQINLQLHVPAWTWHGDKIITRLLTRCDKESRIMTKQPLPASRKSLQSPDLNTAYA